MKFFMIILLFFVLVLNSFSQATNPNVPLTSEDYLSVSRKQKTTAIVFLGVGTTAIAGGLLISVGQKDELDRVLTTTFVGVPLMLAGTILDVISIPIFTSARKNKRRATELDASIGFENKVPLPGRMGMPNTSPILSVKVRF